MNTLPLELTTVYEQLTSFAGLESFWDSFNIAFGSEYDQAKVENLRIQWLNQDFSQLPNIRVLDSGMGPMLGAYASVTDTIYLSQSFLDRATDEQIAAVIIEEIGHSLDAKINQTDSPGDEGELFSDLARGVNLTVEDVQAIKSQNDFATIIVDGEIVPIEAATLTVTNTNDSGAGSLRNAIAAALAGDTIVFDTTGIFATAQTITLTSGALSITQNLTINGTGASKLTVSGANAVQVFNISGSGTTVNIDGMTIANGSVTGNGGGIAVGTGSTLNLSNSTVSGNSATGAPAANGKGGGIYNNGTLTVTNSTISGNSATFNGGGINNFGGTVTVTNSTISGNSATLNGGGIHNNTSRALTITNSTVSGNTAANNGGGIFSNNSSRLTVTNSTISGNSTPGAGGGIYTLARPADITNSTISGNSAGLGGGGLAVSNGTANITNSTISGNSTNGTAGGIYNFFSTSTLTNSTISGNSANNNAGGVFSNNGTANLNNSTITNNTADSDNNGAGNGGGIFRQAGTFNVQNTIVAGNFDTPNNAGSGTINPDVSGTFTDNGNNLIGIDQGSSSFVNGTNNNIVGTFAAPVNPQLGALANNGGPTQTHALLLGSPAIDVGTNPNSLTTDQRGFVRVFGSAADIGAFELSNTAPTAVNLQNTTPSLAENTSTTSRIKVADIDIIDDALGTETITLTGIDASFFEVDGLELFLKANTVLNFESKSSYAVTVNVDDPTVGSNPDVTTNFTLTITDVNEAPTIALANKVTSLAENTDTTTRVKVADIVVTDDALGTNNLSLSGADKDLFEIMGTELFIKAGTSLDFETNSVLDVTVEVDDPALGLTFEDSVNFSLALTDVVQRITTPNRDSINTGSGNDVVITTLDNLRQRDSINGGAGNDTLVLNGPGGTTPLEINLSNASQVLVQPNFIGLPIPFFFFPVPWSKSSIKGFENVDASGFTGNLNLTGSNLSQALKGGSGADRIFGLGGDDLIDGGLGADELTGGLGDDMVYLGNDSVGDKVYYNAGDGTDTVFQFNRANDQIIFSGIANINVQTVGSNTELRNQANNQLLMTLKDTTGFSVVDVGANQALTGTSFSFL